MGKLHTKEREVKVLQAKLQAQGKALAEANKGREIADKALVEMTKAHNALVDKLELEAEQGEQNGD